MGVPGSGVDFVPPAEADKAPAGDVFQVVEVGGEEEHGEDEDEDAVLGGGWGVSEGGGGKGGRGEGGNGQTVGEEGDVEAEEVDEEGGWEGGGG